MELSKFKSRTYRLLVTSWFGVFINHPLVSIVATATAETYFLYLDIFGGQDKWVQEHQELSLRLFVGVIFVGLFVQLLRWIGQWSAGPSQNEGSAIMELVVSVGRIVERKIERFRQASPMLDGRSPFALITKPADQIQIILGEVNDYFRRQHLLDEHQIDGTVMRLSSVNNNWQFAFKSNPTRKRMDPNLLMSEKSTAAEAHRTGRLSFHPSKQLAASVNLYRFGESESDNGSIFCYPVQVDLPNGRAEEFVITFATYGHCLCDSADDNASKAISFIFREFSRRIELELVLWTIKDYKTPAKKTRALPIRKKKHDA